MSTSILVKLSSELSEAGFILPDSMMPTRRGPKLPHRESFRDYLRRVMAETDLTSRQIEDITAKAGWKVSKSWVNLVLTKDEGIENAGIKTLFALAGALNRSREEVIAAFMEEPLPDSIQLLSNLSTAFEKLTDADKDHYTRVIEDVIRSMRRAVR